MKNSRLRDIGERLAGAKNILVTTHIRPDGDAVGSLLGLGLALLEFGKPVQMVLADGIPQTYRHLQGFELVTKKPKEAFDVSVALDCSDLSRLGTNPQPDHRWQINIDHHLTNDRYAEQNYIDPKAVATTEVIFRALEIWKFPITKPVAEALLTGLLTDTIGFRTRNVNAKTLRMAAKMVDFGLDLPELYAKALYQRSYQAIQFWGAGLSRIERKGGMVWTWLTMEDRRLAGYPGRDDADLINVLTTIEDGLVYLIFVEQPKGRVKVSWRAGPGHDVAEVASLFGGGGHSAAAGAEMDGEMQAVKETVLATTFEKLLS